MPLNFGGPVGGGGLSAKTVRNKVKQLAISPADWSGPTLLYTRSLVQGGDADPGGTVVAPVELPSGATITDIIVYGNTPAAEKTWSLYAMPINASSPDTLLATASINSAAISEDHIVDNGLFHYTIEVLLFSGTAPEDQIFGSVITYIVPIDFADEGTNL